jgi:hypothetical protein
MVIWEEKMLPVHSWLLEEKQAVMPVVLLREALLREKQRMFSCTLFLSPEGIRRVNSFPPRQETLARHCVPICPLFS